MLSVCVTSVKAMQGKEYSPSQIKELFNDYIRFAKSQDNIKWHTSV